MKDKLKNYTPSLEVANERIQFIRKNIKSFTGFAPAIINLLHLIRKEEIFKNENIASFLGQEWVLIACFRNSSRQVKKALFVNSEGHIIQITRVYVRRRREWELTIQEIKNDLFWLPVLNAFELRKIIKATGEWTTSSWHDHQKCLNQLNSGAWHGEISSRKFGTW